jgi:hypothetical protein
MSAQEQTPPAVAPAPAQPALGPDGKPLAAAIPVKGKPEKKKKEKPPKVTPVTIQRGILTVDGWAAKAALNYDIADLKYIYISTPGVGTAVISNEPFPGAKAQPDAFNEGSLKVTVDGHQLEIASDKRLLPGKKPVTAWVLLDTTYTYPANSAVVGYGYDTKAPYTWPGSKPNATVKGIASNAPPVPTYLRPTPTAGLCAPLKPGMTEVQMHAANPNNLPPCKAGPVDKNGSVVAGAPAPAPPAATPEPPPPVVSAGAPSTPETAAPAVPEPPK